MKKTFSDKKDTKEYTKGFSLIELIVAVALFTVVMTMATGAILSVFSAYHKSQSLQTAMTNIDTAMENMSRNIRLGTKIHCGSSGTITSPQDCASGASFLAIEGRQGDTTIATDQIIYRQTGALIEKSVDGGATYLPITAPEVTITNLSFYVVGAPGGDSKQPKVLMTLSGYAGVREARTDFNIQTMVTQRVFDN